MDYFESRISPILTLEEQKSWRCFNSEHKKEEGEVWSPKLRLSVQVPMDYRSQHIFHPAAYLFEF